MAWFTVATAWHETYRDLQLPAGHVTRDHGPGTADPWMTVSSAGVQSWDTEWQWEVTIRSAAYKNVIHAGISGIVSGKATDGYPALPGTYWPSFWFQILEVTAYTSVRASVGSPVACSGAM